MASALLPRQVYNKGQTQPGAELFHIINVPHKDIILQLSNYSSIFLLASILKVYPLPVPKTFPIELFNRTKNNLLVIKMPHGISSKALEKFIKAVPWEKVVKKAEHAEQGTRLWPTNMSKDADLNFRIDKGSNIGGRRAEVILQANKNAKDKSVEKAARKDSHQIVAKAIADAQNDVKGDMTREQIEQDFETRK